MPRLSLIAAALAAVMFVPTAYAQQQSTSPAPPPAPPYGTPITLEQAKKVAAAGEAYARAHNLTEAIAIVEPSGALVYFLKMDGTQYAGANVALDKATSAAIFRRPTTAFEGGLRGGNLYLFNLRGMNAVPGGIPIIVQGKLIGGIGASGGSGAEDTATVEAAIAALK